MREIKVSEVTDVIAKLCMDSCYYLPQEMMDKIRNAAVEEESPLGREILATLIEKIPGRLQRIYADSLQCSPLLRLHEWQYTNRRQRNALPGRFPEIQRSDRYPDTEEQPFS